MLKQISIRDVVLIERLDLEIGAGFTALTGETGAGKSILLDALGLALGERSDKSLIRAGAAKAIASATFEIGNNPIARQILETADIEIENGEIVLRRSLTNDGKSRGFVNDTQVSISTMRELAQTLLEVHGQHSAIGLTQTNSHQTMLDGFLCAEMGSDFVQILGQTQKNFSERTKAFEALENARALIGKTQADTDYLRHILDELEKLAPKTGEEATLDSERRFLMGAERIIGAIKEAVDYINSGKIAPNLANAARAISKIGSVDGENAAKLNKAIENAANALERAQNDVAEASDLLSQAGYAIDLDPKLLERIEERLFALRASARKHNVTVVELGQVIAKTRAKLGEIDNREAELRKCEAEFVAIDAQYRTSAESLSNARKKGANIFERKIIAELPPLKLDKMRFQTTIETDFARNNASGFDKVVFEIAPNPGAGYGPLSQIASGGELSRLSLAIKVVMAQGIGALALVFDEVDQGIGGATADAVGKRLAVLAKKSQVLCVTHSPQVAARADHHLRIEKAIKDGITLTDITPLDMKTREEEVARMLAGETVSEASRHAARELLGLG